MNDNNSTEDNSGDCGFNYFAKGYLNEEANNKINKEIGIFSEESRKDDYNKPEYPSNKKTFEKLREKENFSTTIRYDEQFKHLKSRAFKLKLEKLKEEKENKLSIKVILNRFRYVFTADAVKSVNKHYFAKTIGEIIKDIFSGDYEIIKLVENMIKTISGKERKQTSGDAGAKIKKKGTIGKRTRKEKILTPKQLEKKKATLKKNEDEEIELKKVDVDVLGYFNSEASKDILSLTYGEVMQEFRNSNDFKLYKQEIHKRFKDSNGRNKIKEENIKKYLDNFDLIANDLSGYLGVSKINKEFKKGSSLNINN